MVSSSAPAHVCDRCGYAVGLARLRVLWMPDDGPKFAQGVGEYLLCHECRGIVMDSLKPVEAKK